MSIGKSRMSMVLAGIITLICLVGCSSDAPAPISQVEAEPLVANCVIVQSIDGESIYRTTNEELIADLLPLLSTAVSLKESEATWIWALQNDSLVKTSYTFKREWYASWGEETPAALLDAVEKITVEENRVFCYQFLANDPTQHEQRMQAIRSQESAQFFMPRTEQGLDNFYPTLNLYYTCYDYRFHEWSGAVETDWVFDETVAWLEQHDMVYKVVDPANALSSSTSGQFSRRMKVLLYKPPDTVILEKIEAILEYSTADAPFLRPDGSSSGNVKYEEPAPYTISMIVDAPVPDDKLLQLEHDYGIEYSGNIVL